MTIPSLLSFKVIFISASLLSAAVALKLSVPAITDFAVSEVPSIYNVVVSWLRPPYLYLLINCIIITIVASSKLQSKLDPVALSPEGAPPLHPHPVPVALPPPHVQLIQPHDFDSRGSNVVLAEAVVSADVRTPQAINFEYGDSLNDLDRFEDKSLEDDKEFVTAANATVDASPPEVEINCYTKDEFAISKSSWSPSTVSRKDALEFPVSSEKPPVSSRFGHRRAIKASPEGGKAALGVSKPKRQDTLESTWKTITEGRAMPLTRHLRKSDTWETHGGRHQVAATQNQKMSKSETFNDGVSRNDDSSLLKSSPGSGKLKREASLSQDELNRRVEAFIKKFNEEMRLQRQESLNQYMEMINRGAQ